MRVVVRRRPGGWPDGENWEASLQLGHSWWGGYGRGVPGALFDLVKTVGEIGVLWPMEELLRRLLHAAARGKGGK